MFKPGDIVYCETKYSDEEVPVRNYGKVVSRETASVLPWFSQAPQLGVVWAVWNSLPRDFPEINSMHLGYMSEDSCKIYKSYAVKQRNLPDWF